MTTTDSPTDEPAGSSTADATTALQWWDAASLTAPAHRVPLDVSSTAQPAIPNLLAERPHRSPLRPGVLVPIGLVVAVVLAYCVSMAAWPLTSVAPTVVDAELQPVASEAAAMSWPKKGAAGVGVDGLAEPVSSTGDESPIASLTKVITALMVLDESPVTEKDQGRDFSFTYADTLTYWNYRARNESALDVPVGGTLTEYQVLEGMLIGSANNYAALLGSTWWGSDATFASAANSWLDSRGISGITIADPTGFDHGNTATPTALIEVAELAMDDPVIAGIVQKKKITLPGAGDVENTNELLLKDPGVIGLKTGSLEGYNLITVKDVDIDGTTVQLYAAVLNQPSDKKRWSVSRDVLAQLEQQLRESPPLAAGTTVGTVHTEWGETVPVVTAKDADVVLWNGATAKVVAELTLGDWDRGADAGKVTATGPLNTTTVAARLSTELSGPSLWWRLTHPLDLLGIE